MEPITLRHKDAKNQAIMYGAFAAVMWAFPLWMFANDSPAKWWFATFVLPALFLTYSALRLATLRVRLDKYGLWEPNPFRLTYVTEWKDIQRVRPHQEKGKMKLRFLSVEVVERSGEVHEVIALKLQAGAAYAEPTLRSWIDQIREAQKVWG